MAFLAIAVVALSLAVAAPVAASLLAHPPDGLLAENYRGRSIPRAGGIVIAAGFLAGEVGLTLAYLAKPGSTGHAASTFASRDHWGLALVVLGFLAVGSIDDGSEAHARGFRGHLAALCRGEVTGGLIKAAGGGAIALVAGALWEGHLGPAVLDAVVVAGSANLTNLLDLRPGRATKVFLLAWVALALAAWGGAWVTLSLPVAGAAALWLVVDLRERGMLGDAGANLLGAVAGTGAVLTLGVPGRLAVAGIIVVLTAISEKFSFSVAIARIPPLRWLDRLGQIRVSSPPAPGAAE